VRDKTVESVAEALRDVADGSTVLVGGFGLAGQPIAVIDGLLEQGAPDAIPAVGGAMGLAIGAKSVWVMIDLVTKAGESELVQRCTSPLTGVGCVTRVHSDRGVFGVGADGVTVVDGFGADIDELRELTRLDLKEAR
jgi:acyl CoA:acetate/3-ketoacid CoA transferase beta subunit